MNKALEKMIKSPNESNLEHSRRVQVDEHGNKIYPMFYDEDPMFYNGLGPMCNAPKPSRYNGMAMDVIQFCSINKIPFAEGNIIKYVCRWRQKDGLADLIKARDYLNRLIEEAENGMDK